MLVVVAQSLKNKSKNIAINTGENPMNIILVPTKVHRLMRTSYVTFIPRVVCRCDLKRAFCMSETYFV